MKIVATIEQSMPISLDARNRYIAFKAINLEVTGEELVPLNMKVSQAHKDAHYSICISDTLNLLVDIYEDGSKKYRIG